MLFKKNKKPLSISTVEEVANNLMKIKLSNNMHFENKTEHTFPDGYSISTSINEKMFMLKKENQNLAIFKFGLNYLKEKNNQKQLSPTITIDFIQGIKQKNNQEIPKKWPETIMNSFIYATIPSTAKNPKLKIRYDEFIPFSDGKERNLQRKEYISSLRQEKVIAKQMGHKDPKKFFYLDKEIEIAENRLKFVNALRERYFDKEGWLNLNKKRVQEIHKLYEKNLKKKELRRKLKLIPLKKQKIKIKKNIIRRLK